MMDLDDFRSVLESTGVDVWTFIDTAIMVAASDYGEELRERRDKIVERLYSQSGWCRNCGSDSSNSAKIRHEIKNLGGGGGGDGGVSERGKGRESVREGEDDHDEEEEEEELDPYGGLFEVEEKRVLDIKLQLDDPDQSEESLVDLLQHLADMEITFSALKETDIGRHVNKLRKHPSNEVRRLVKQLVRKWKDIVDDWVRLNPQGDPASSALMADDSPQQKITQNGHHQVPDFAYSPNPHNGSSGSEKNNSEPERKPKPVLNNTRKEAPTRPPQLAASASASHNVQRQREQQKESNFDVDQRLASARRRLQENYKEAENAKKQRTIQVMDIHEIPKPKNKNVFFAKNKGGGSHGRHW